MARAKKATKQAKAALLPEGDWNTLPPVRFVDRSEALEYVADQLNDVLALAVLGRGYCDEQPAFQPEIRNAAQRAAYQLAKLLRLVAEGHEGPIMCGEPGAAGDPWIALIPLYRDVESDEERVRVDASVEPILRALRDAEAA